MYGRGDCTRLELEKGNNAYSVPDMKYGELASFVWENQALPRYKKKKELKQILACQWTRFSEVRI